MTNNILFFAKPDRGCQEKIRYPHPFLKSLPFHGLNQDMRMRLLQSGFSECNGLPGHRLTGILAFMHDLGRDV